MALSLSATKTQLPPQANAAAEPDPGLAGIDAGTSPLFADALRQLALALDEPVPHDASMPAEPAATEPAPVTGEMGDEADEATVGIETTLQGMIPPLTPLVLPIAYRTALQTQLPQESPAPVTVVTAVATQSARTVEMQAAAHIEGIPLPAAGLISLQQASATGRGTEFTAAPPVLQDGIAGERLIDATQTSLVVQAVRSTSAQSVENPISIAVKEHVASAATASAAADPAMAPVAAPVAASAASAPVEAVPAAILKLPAGAPQQWRQPLTDALGDRIQTQIGMRSESAVIRLDPPMMGQIEIRIHHEAGALQVQLSASHGEVVRQLNEIREHLRQDLVHRQYTDVSVLVSGNTPDGRQRQRQPEAEHDAPGRALSEPGQEADTFALLSDRD